MLFAVLAILLSFAAPAVVGASGRGRQIIIDSDIFSSVDDVGALTVANVLHNRGEANLLGVMVNTPSRYGALTVDVGFFNFFLT